MRDNRNDIIQTVQLAIMDLREDVQDRVIAALTSALEPYEISERVTALVPSESNNLEILKTYASSLLIDGKSEKTIKMYIYHLKKLGQTTDLLTATTYDIRNYLAHRKVSGISNRSLENERSYISAFYQWLTNESYIEKNPCLSIKPIKYADEIRKPFSPVEIDKLRSACKDEKERALIEFLLSSGVRVSELVNLRIDDIDFTHKTVKVRNGKGGKDRVTYINDVSCEHLIAYMIKQNILSGYIFLSSRGVYTANGVRALLNRIAVRANVEDVHPHRFRRTFASMMAARGMDIQTIQKLMGHTDINTTMIYITTDDSLVSNSYQKYTAA